MDPALPDDIFAIIVDQLHDDCRRIAHVMPARCIAMAYVTINTLARTCKRLDKMVRVGAIATADALVYGDADNDLDITYDILPNGKIHGRFSMYDRDDTCSIRWHVNYKLGVPGVWRLTCTEHTYSRDHVTTLWGCIGSPVVVDADTSGELMVDTYTARIDTQPQIGDAGTYFISPDFTLMGGKLFVNVNPIEPLIGGLVNIAAFERVFEDHELVGIMPTQLMRLFNIPLEKIPAELRHLVI